jgi:hypothetical protein
MAQAGKDSAPLKSDNAKGEDTAHSRLNKEADEAAKKAGKTEQAHDKANPIFTK